MEITTVGLLNSGQEYQNMINQIEDSRLEPTKMQYTYDVKPRNYVLMVG